MIAADVVYLRPDTAEEAVDAWRRHAGARYLAGGTEIATAARRTAAFDLRACIDVKRIPEANVHEICGGCLRLGAALTLSDVAEGDSFPLLNAVLRGIADRTVRNRLTLGGNLAGLLPYREAALPLLLADATVLTVAPGADDRPPVRQERPLRAIFDKRLVLAPGELVLSFCVPLEAPEWPWSHYRRTRTGEVDYPLVTVAMVHDGAGIRFAVSGAHPYPFRSDAVDARLTEWFATRGSEEEIPPPSAAQSEPDSPTAQGRGGLKSNTEPQARGGLEPELEAIVAALGPLRADARASLEYRGALLKNMIRAGLEDLA